MTTETDRGTTTVRHPDDDPDVVAARASLEPLIQREIELAALERRYADVLDPYVENAGPVSIDARLEALQHYTSVRVEHAKLARECRAAEAAWQHARESARERVHASCHLRKRELVQKIDRLLSQVAPLSRELAGVEDEERNATGAWHLSGFAWPEFLPATPEQGSRIDDWRRAATEAGLLDVRST